MKSLKSLLILFSKIILFFSIHIDILYPYCFPVSCYSTVNIVVLSFDVVLLDMLTLTILLLDI